MTRSFIKKILFLGSVSQRSVTMCSTTAKNAASPSPNPSRRTKTKTRKPKFVSLRRDFSPESEIAGDMNQLQLNLFPLHPENLFGEKDTHDHVDYFFESENGGGATLNGLLAAGPCPSSSSSEEPLSPSLTYAYDRHDGDGTGSLARAALRRKERDTSEEKWVAYSDVATREKEEGSRDVRYRAPGLSLKLDYQEILNSWSDKSPLYIDGEGTQIVPNLDEIHAHDSNTVYTTSLELGGCRKDARGVWTVPDSGSVAEGGGVEGKMSGREARVLRYKEKRQSRLFSKRIRYEVRKLNAEKRPRMKGRFVKRKLQA